MINKIRKQPYQILIFQLTAVLLLAIIVLIFKQNILASLSIILGGLAYLIPSILFVAKFFSAANLTPCNDSSNKKLLIAFYSGEIIKLILSFISLLLLFHFIPVKIIFVLIGYGAASLSLLFLPAAFASMNKHRDKK